MKSYKPYKNKDCSFLFGVDEVGNTTSCWVLWVFFMVLCGVHEFGLWWCFSFCYVIDFTAAACHDFRDGVKQILVIDHEKLLIKPLNSPYLDQRNFINHQVLFKNLITLLYLMFFISV